MPTPNEILKWVAAALNIEAEAYLYEADLAGQLVRRRDNPTIELRVEHDGARGFLVVTAPDARTVKYGFSLTTGIFDYEAAHAACQKRAATSVPAAEA